MCGGDWARESACRVIYHIQMTVGSMCSEVPCVCVGGGGGGLGLGRVPVQ